ncbi:MAG: hypothetical protein GKC04_04635 [Methanomicrobiales archaeon]|nr:hypothetical protein [Methanomicrobiales archaeon]
MNRIQSHVQGTTITRGIGFALYAFLTTYFLAIILFGRQTGCTAILLAGEALAGIVLGAVFIQRGYHWKTLCLPCTIAVLLSIGTAVLAAVAGSCIIHAPSPVP